jgi:hypothetical protein
MCPASESSANDPDVKRGDELDDEESGHQDERELQPPPVRAAGMPAGTVAVAAAHDLASLP